MLGPRTAGEAEYRAEVWFPLPSEQSEDVSQKCPKNDVKMVGESCVLFQSGLQSQKVFYTLPKVLMVKKINHPKYHVLQVYPKISNTLLFGNYQAVVQVGRFRIARQKAGLLQGSSEKQLGQGVRCQNLIALRKLKNVDHV